MNKRFTVDTLQLIQLPHFADTRGQFVKSFNDQLFQGFGINFQLKESYYSFSGKDVIRGMHFQLPPHQHAKIVFCPVGKILDVALDLRKDSPKYGQAFAQILSSENNKAYYIPEGFAHGFKALTEGALTYYLVSSGYHPASDTGIAYNSFGFDWECALPIMSERDTSFINFNDFESPF
ncbi:MAG: dTDP-4-dehydrorhamnose 3,5-epimerase family protein [Chitinophagaceae bacterium]|nr:dTDP-4-dehydrorhamnose 3,5-epimerase family protein [Chitinophagaceae bacterium]